MFALAVEEAEIAEKLVRVQDLLRKSGRVELGQNGLRRKLAVVPPARQVQKVEEKRAENAPVLERELGAETANSVGNAMAHQQPALPPPANA